MRNTARNVEPNGEYVKGKNALTIPWGPLAFEKLATFVADRHAAGQFGPIHVQCRIKGAVVCGVVEEAAVGHQADFIKARTPIGVHWVSAWNARACSGDGRCTCEASAAERAGTARVAADAAPLGNTGTTLEGGA